jgi:hypothetical protein
MKRGWIADERRRYHHHPSFRRQGSVVVDPKSFETQKVERTPIVCSTSAEMGVLRGRP